MANSSRPPCLVCEAGKKHSRCGGHRKGDGQPCGRWPRKGGVVCRQCGGNTPQARKAEERRVGEEKARRAVATYGLPVDIDPGSALLEEVSRTAGHVRWLHDVVKDLDPDGLVWGEKQSSHQEGVGPEGPVDMRTETQAAGVNVWLELYLKERDHLRKVCSDALKAGIAERQVQLAEQAGERAGQWLRASLEVLGLSDQDMRKVMAAGVRHLHLLEGTA